MSDPGVAERPPTYCPKCRRPADGEGRLCEVCGEALRPMGYCPVCEGWVLAPPAAACPKHDLGLLEAPEGPGLERASSRLVTVATFGLPAEAHARRLRLEAEGIPAFLIGERMGANAIYQVATGGVRLQVPEELAHEARVLLSQTWAPPKGDLDDWDDDDPWEGLGPEPAERRRAVMKVAILLFLFGPVVFAGLGWLLAALGRR